MSPLCKGDKESAIHLLARSPFPQIVWRLSPLVINMKIAQGNSILGWWDNLLERWKGMKEHMQGDMGGGPAVGQSCGKFGSAGIMVTRSGSNWRCIGLSERE